MAQSVAVVRATLSATSGGTTDFTKAGLGTVTAALIFTCNASVSTNPQSTGAFSVGFWDGTNQRTTLIRATDNVTTTSTIRGSDDSYGALAVFTGGQSAYTVSAITDGIRITLSVDATTLERHCTVLLIGGVSSSLLTVTMADTQDSTVESASLGFAPKAGFFTTIGDTVADRSGQTTAEAVISFGFAKNDGTHRMVAFSSVSGAADEVSNILYSEARCVGEVYNDATTWAGEVTTWGTDTLTITTRDGASGSDVVFMLALGGDVSFDCGTLTTPTATGADVIATDITPDAVLVMLSTATGTTLHADSGANGLMIGAADADGQFSHATYVEDGAATTNTGSVASAAALINLDTSAAGSRADMIDATVALNQSDFTLTYTAVDASARKGFWIAFGAPATPVVCVDSTWGTSWCASWGTSWQRSAPPAPSVDQARTLGNFKWDRQRRKPRVIRYSDYETREAYAAAIAAAALPIAEIPLDTTIDEWEEFEDDFIAFQLMRLLH